MKMNFKIQQLIAGLAIVSVAAAPMTAAAQSQHDLKHRQDLKNMWRNLGIAGGAVGLYGLLKGDSTLATLGIAGGLYSAYRYEQDRKSQSRMQRRRAAYFSHRVIHRNGHTYRRKTVYRNGHKYYGYFRA